MAPAPDAMSVTTGSRPLTHRLQKPNQESPPPPPPPSAPSKAPPPAAGLGHFRADLWFSAVKPPMYTVAISPITIGSLAAAADTAAFSLSRMLVFLLCTVGIIAWTNLTNDVFDFDTGIDVHKAESVVNLLGATRAARNRVLAFANLLLLTAFAGVVAISTVPSAHPSASFALDPVVPVLIAAAIMIGFMYQAPPFRLGYYGLGEPLCFTAWTLGVMAAYYSQLSATPATAAALHASLPTASARLRVLLMQWPFERTRSLGAAALLVAFPTTLILFCSHFHQIDDDERAGKKSPVVRLGSLRASHLVVAVVRTIAAMHVVLLVTGRLDIVVFCAALPSAPLALRTASFVRENHYVPHLVRPAKYHAVKFHFVHGTLVAVAYALIATTSVWSA